MNQANVTIVNSMYMLWQALIRHEMERQQINKIVSSAPAASTTEYVYTYLLSVSDALSKTKENTPWSSFGNTESCSTYQRQAGEAA